MEKKEPTPRRVARRSYEERNKDKRKQTSGNFGTMIPRDCNAFFLACRTALRVAL